MCDEVKKGVRPYEPPVAYSLSGATAAGQQYEAKGTCRNGTGPGYCLNGISPVDQCYTGNGASAYENCTTGSYAALSCNAGTRANAQNCRTGTRPQHCYGGSRA